jgi:hypothetical protein
MTDELFEKLFVTAAKNAACAEDFVRLKEVQQTAIKTAIRGSVESSSFGAHRLQALVQTFAREFDRAEAMK